MTAVLPVWSTTGAILAYVWRGRRLAIRYAALPVAALFLLDLGGILAGVDIDKNTWWQIVTGLLSLLAYAPFTVTWFQSIVDGEAAAEARPVFVIAELEKNVILANIRVAVFVLFVSLVLVAILGGAFYGIYRVAPQLMEIAAAVVAGPALFIWVMLLTRVTLVIAYAAAGEPITLRAALRLTAPMAYRLTWIHIIVANVAFIFVGVAVGGVELFDIHKGVAVSIALSVMNTLGGIVYLILVTTLFGFVYRRLRETTSDAA